MSDPTIDAMNKSLPKGERMAPGLQSVLAMQAGAIGMAMTPAPLSHSGNLLALQSAFGLNKAFNGTGKVTEEKLMQAALQRTARPDRDRTIVETLKRPGFCPGAYASDGAATNPCMVRTP